MKIAYVSRRASPARGGIESFLQRLSRQMVASGHDVSIAAQRIDSELNRPVWDAVRTVPFKPFADDSIPVRPFTLSPARRLATLPLLLQSAGRLRRPTDGRAQELVGAGFARIAAPPLARVLRGADIVHVMGGYDIACAGVAAAARLGVPVVVSPFAHPGAWDDDAASAWAYRRADRVTATLESDAETYRALGVPDDRLAIIGLFCDTPPDDLDATHQRVRHGIDGPLIVFLAGRYAHKGVDVLLAATDAVHRAHPTATFAFVGPGPAVESPGGARVLDAGAVDDRERWEWLAAADILCLPSAAETFGLVLLEAWATHTAVITSDIPPLAELVELAGGGTTAPRDPAAVAAAIVALLDDPRRARALAAAGHAYWHDNGRPEEVGARFEGLYVTVLR